MSGTKQATREQKRIRDRYGPWAVVTGAADGFTSSVLKAALILATAFALPACASPANSYAISDHYDGERFFNAEPVPDVGLWKLAKHILTGRSTPWPDFVPNDPALRLDAASTRNRSGHPDRSDRAAITFVGHATVLIQWRGVNLLTDPVWSTRVGPFSWAGPKRVREPGIPIEVLPRIDAILISHNHYDHLDLPTLRRLYKRDRPRIFVPLGDARLLAAE